VTAIFFYRRTTSPAGEAACALKKAQRQSRDPLIGTFGMPLRIVLSGPLYCFFRRNAGFTRKRSHQNEDRMPIENTVLAGRLLRIPETLWVKQSLPDYPIHHGGILPHRTERCSQLNMNGVSIVSLEVFKGVKGTRESNVVGIIRMVLPQMLHILSDFKVMQKIKFVGQFFNHFD
jgi:hypothetical protein